MDERIPIVPSRESLLLTPQVSSTLGIRGIPTLILFKGGKAVNQVVGAVPKIHLKALIENPSDKRR
jgi:thioredoxin-like negative regulator of GroEL